MYQSKKQNVLLSFTPTESIINRAASSLYPQQSYHELAELSADLIPRTSLMITCQGKINFSCMEVFSVFQTAFSAYIQLSIKNTSIKTIPAGPLIQSMYYCLQWKICCQAFIVARISLSTARNKMQAVCACADWVGVMSDQMRPKGRI